MRLTCQSVLVQCSHTESSRVFRFPHNVAAASLFGHQPSFSPEGPVSVCQCLHGVPTPESHPQAMPQGRPTRYRTPTEEVLRDMTYSSAHTNALTASSSGRLSCRSTRRAAGTRGAPRGQIARGLAPTSGIPSREPEATDRGRKTDSAAVRAASGFPHKWTKGRDEPAPDNPPHCRLMHATPQPWEPRPFLPEHSALPSLRPPSGKRRPADLRGQHGPRTPYGSLSGCGTGRLTPPRFRAPPHCPEIPVRPGILAAIAVNDRHHHAFLP